jgi:DNA-binding winged helix-turn-helix (wHTH) protein
MTAAEKTTGAARRRGALGAELVGPGVLVRGEREVQLRTRECALVAVLFDHFPHPLPTAEFSRLLWPAAAPSEIARRRCMMLLRRRLATVGLALRCQTRVGYTLEESPWVLDIASGPNQATASALPR